MQTIVGIGHVAIRVKDVARTLNFYVGKLGFEEMLRLDRDGRLWLLYLRITETQYLEVFPEGEGDRASGKEAVGFNHICLQVSDIDAAVAELAKLEIPLTNPLKTGLDGNRQAWIEDPDGHRIELMEMAPDCLQFQGLARLRQKRG
ncbi:VOC family protein [Terrarubrum flagellatum]|uniref:VOC family protein n=1 Tax=Terrirubrum flagellatum TaxID=2895980 RepID=UPI0031455BEF